MSEWMNAFSTRLVPVAVIDRAEDALPLGQALLAGGLNVIEVTLRTDAALAAIGILRRELPELVAGAGTVIDAELVPELAGMGVAFAVSPGLNDKVADACEAVSMPLIPGIITPTELERARARGLRLLKFFPAEAAGGVTMLKALAGPYGHTGIRFVPTGGISLQTLPDYLALPTVAAVGGSWFVNPKLIREGRFEEITRLTAEAIAITRTFSAG